MAFATIAAYSRVPEFGFVNWDDPHYVTTNSHVMSGLSWENVRWAFTTDYPPYWHPITWLSHMADVEMFGLNAGGHHVTNLVLHVLSAILLFGLLRALTQAAGRSAIVAAFFALHPLHVESVAWVAERKDLLSTLFWVLTTWQYYKYVTGGNWQSYSLMSFFFVLGLMTKPMLVTLPFALLLLDVWPLRRVMARGSGRDATRRWSELIREKVPLFALALTLSALTFALQRGTGSLGDLESLSWGYRVQNALVSYVSYIAKMFWPTSLAALYPLRPSIPVWMTLTSLLVLAGVTTAFIRIRGQYPYALVGWLWYLGTLVPVIGLIQAGDQAMADRFTYVPMIGLFIVVVWGLADTLVRFKYPVFTGRAATFVVLLTLAFLTHTQARYWRNSLSLWTRTLEVTSGNHRAENLIGNELLNAGNISAAMAHYDAALRIRPGFADAHNGRGSAFHAQNQLDSAYHHYLEALRLNPELPEAHNNLGNILVDAGNIQEAVRHFKEGLARSPDSPDLRTGLGAALSAEGKHEEAIGEFLKVLRLRPDADAEFNVGVTYAEMNEISQARNHLEAASRLNPSHIRAREQIDLLRQRDPTETK